MGLIKYRKGIDGHAVEGVDLFRDPHDAEFRTHGRAGPAGHHQGGQDRAEFHDQGQRNGGSEHPLGPEFIQRIVALQPQDHAG